MSETDFAELFFVAIIASIICFFIALAIERYHYDQR